MDAFSVFTLQHLRFWMHLQCKLFRAWGYRCIFSVHSLEPKVMDASSVYTLQNLRLWMHLQCTLFRTWGYECPFSVNFSEPEVLDEFSVYTLHNLRLLMHLECRNTLQANYCNQSVCLTNHRAPSAFSTNHRAYSACSTNHNAYSKVPVGFWPIIECLFLSDQSPMLFLPAWPIIMFCCLSYLQYHRASSACLTNHRAPLTCWPIIEHHLPVDQS